MQGGERQFEFNCLEAGQILTHKWLVRTWGEEMSFQIALSGGQHVASPPRRTKALVAVSVDPDALLL